LRRSPFGANDGIPFGANDVSPTSMYRQAKWSVKYVITQISSKEE